MTDKEKKSMDSYINIIDEMLRDKLFVNANPFLHSIKFYIEKNNKISEKQKNAINNIYIKFSERMK